MPDDPTLAVRAGRREHMNRAFEAVESMFAAALANRERLVVFVAAHITFCHKRDSSPYWFAGIGQSGLVKLFSKTPAVDLFTRGVC